MTYDVPVLIPGKYRLASGKVVRYTPADADNCVRVGNAQLKAGLSVPLCWEHDPRAKPDYLSRNAPGKDSDLHDAAWVAKGFFGHTKRFKKRSDGVVVAEVDIPDEADARQFVKVGKVSPMVARDWQDEKHVRWPGLTVLHIASTPKPIQRHLDAVSAYPGRFPHGAESLSFTATITRSKPMADEAKEAGEMGGGADTSVIAEIVEKLKELGIHMDGDIADLASLNSHLTTAIQTMNGGSATEPDGDEMPAEGDPLSDDTESVSQPMYMSQLPPKLAKKAAELKHRERLDRIEKLGATNRVPATRKAELVKEAEAELLPFQADQLSQTDMAKFTADLELADTKLDIVIAAYEALPAGKLAAKGDALSHTTARVISPIKVKPAVEAEQDELEKDMRSRKGLA